jgi:hypothetical protein
VLQAVLEVDIEQGSPATTRMGGAFEVLARAALP